MKNMLTKKILSAILAVTVIFGALPVLTVPTFAADKATVTLESATVSPGETFELKLTIKDNPGLDSLLVSLSYDKSVFTIDKVKNGDVFPEDEYGTFDSELNQMWIYANPDESLITADGVLCTYTFKVSEEASGDYEIKVIFPFDDGKVTAVNSTVKVTEKTVTDISIDSLPARTAYTTRDTLDTTGLVFNVVYSDGSTKKVTSGFTCSPTTFDTVGTQTVTVTYKGKTATFDVTVNEFVPGTVTLESATVSPGETFELKFTIKDNPGLDSLLVSLSYDKSIFTIDKVKNGNVFPMDEYGTFDSGSSQMWTYANPDKSLITADGVLCTYTFKVSEEASGDYEIKVIPFDDGKVTAVNSTVTVNETIVSVDDLTFKLNDNGDGYVVSDCNTSPRGELVIPSEYNGLPVTEIRWNAFEGCANLTSVTIPDSVTVIGSYAFKDCTSLEKINVDSSNECYASENGVLFNKDKTELIKYPVGKKNKEYSIPNSVTSIGDEAFRGCTSLTSVTIPDSIKNIGYYAFYGCSSLTSVTIGNSVTEIEYYAFYNCGSEFVINGYTYSEAHDYAAENGVTFNSIGTVNPLRYKLNDDGKSYHISGYSSQYLFGDYIISSEYDGLPVTGIGYEAFKNCAKLTSITIPNSVTSIGNSAFDGCTNLTSVTIPDSVTSIGYEAFFYCTSLTSVTIPSNVNYIGVRAFGYYENWEIDNVNLVPCSSYWGTLEKVEGFVINGYSYSVAHDYAVRNDIKFNSIGELEPIKYNLNSREDGYVLSDCSYAYAVGDVVIPSEYNGLPVTEIGWGAFEGFAKLISITIPDSVTSISGYSFEGCSGLTSVTIPDSVTSVGGSAFSGCTNLTSITIPNSVTSIGDYAFYGCTSLASITIPESVTYINWGAFEGCDSQLVINGYAYTEAEDYALENNIKFVSLGERPLRYTLNDSKDGYEVIGCSSRYEGELVIPSEHNGLPVTGMRRDAFEDCTNLTSVTIPDSVTRIEYNAFKNCTSLKTVTIPDSVTEIDRGAFYNCSSDFVINGYTYSEAHDYAVENDITFNSIGTCDPLRYELNEDGKSYSIKDVSDAYDFGDYEIPSEYDGLPVTEIGYKAFEGCKSLTSVTIPDSVTSISSYAFSGCTSLKNITIPTSLTQINRGTFRGCTNLTSVIIPNSVVRIEDEAFRDCHNLISVTIPETVAYIGDHAFGYISENNSESGMARGGGRYGFDVLKNFEINGYDYSIAHDYAIANEFTFNSIGTIDKSEVEPLSFKLNEDGVSYTIETAKPSCVVGSFTVPSEHNGLPVTKIENIAFAFCKNLCEITIPQSIESVGANSLGYVWDYTGQSYIEVFHITKKPDFIINGYINSDAHDYAVRHEITFNSIGDAEISVDDMMTFELSEDGNSYALKKCKPSYAIDNFAILMQYNGMSITQISGYAFSGCKLLKTVVIPESVSSIDKAAFLDCTALTHIIIPSSVTKIGAYAIGYKKDYSGWYWEKIEGFTIYGYEGSAAEEYANENGFEFVAITKAADESTGITVEGQIPENTVLTVKQLEAVENKVTFDITLTNNGTAVQPEGNVIVKIPVPAGLDGEACNVYRKEENGTYTDMEASFDGTYLIFTTDHFSEYVVTTENLGFIYGDVNGDGQLTPSDVVLLRRYFANYDSETEISTIEVSAGADANGDGKLTPSDVVLLRRYFANYDSETESSTIVLGK